MTNKAVACLLLNLITAIPMVAQTGAPRPTGSPAANVAPTGVGDIQNLLAQLQAASQTASRDISMLQIDKWKTDRNSKSQAQSNADSLQRNLTAALPGMISDVRARPDDLTASFKLYRNLGALYDVLSSLAESAGAFGPKNDFQALAADVSRLDDSRRLLGDRVATLASIKEGEIARLRTQLHNTPTATQPTANKKIIVDDNEPKKTSTSKKKTTKKPSPGTQSGSASNTSTTGNQQQ